MCMYLLTYFSMSSYKFAIKKILKICFNILFLYILFLDIDDMEIT